MKIVDAVIKLAAAIDENTVSLWEGDMSEPHPAVKIEEILVPLSILEIHAKKLSAKEQAKNEVFITSITLATDRIAILESALEDCRQALLDEGRFTVESLQIISIDNLLTKKDGQ